MVRRAIAVIATAALACASAGCGCNAAGCSSGYSLRLLQEGGLVRGLYEIDVALDGFTAYSCEVDLTGVPERTVACEGFRNAFVEVTAIDGDFSLTIIGEDADNLPDVAEVTVTRDGAVVAMAAVVLDYGSFYPNGKSCDPVCRSGIAAISVPADA